MVDDLRCVIFMIHNQKAFESTVSAVRYDRYHTKFSDFSSMHHAPYALSVIGFVVTALEMLNF
jgi:hypothetical protein